MIKKSWFVLELFTDLPEDHTTNFTIVEQVENITVQVSEIIDKEHYIHKEQTGGDTN